jgi:hypothetical protein
MQCEIDGIPLPWGSSVCIAEERCILRRSHFMEIYIKGR